VPCCYRWCTWRGLYVCLCVGYTGELCKNGWTDPDAFWGLTHGPKEPCIRWRSRSDKSICSREGWQFSDVAFCHITLDTRLLLSSMPTANQFVVYSFNWKSDYIEIAGSRCCMCYIADGTNVSQLFNYSTSKSITDFVKNINLYYYYYYYYCVPCPRSTLAYATLIFTF